MRVKDAENLYSKWSSPAFLALADVQEVTVSVAFSNSTPPTTPQMILPTYAIGLIALAIVLVIITGIISLLVILHLALQHHRKRKLIEKSVCLRPAKRIWCQTVFLTHRERKQINNVEKNIKIKFTVNGDSWAKNKVTNLANPLDIPKLDNFHLTNTNFGFRLAQFWGIKWVCKVGNFCCCFFLALKLSISYLGNVYFFEYS